MKYLQVNLGDDKTNEHDTEIVTETVTILASAPDSPDVECKESLQLLIKYESTVEVVDNIITVNRVNQNRHTMSLRKCQPLQAPVINKRFNSLSQ